MTEDLGSDGIGFVVILLGCPTARFTIEIGSKVTMTAARVATTAAFIAALAPGELLAALQVRPALQQVKVTDRPSCATCRLSFQPWIRLEPAEGVAFGPSPEIVINGRGRIVVSSSTSPGTLLVYTSSGTFDWVIKLPDEAREDTGSRWFLFFDRTDSLHAVESQGVRYVVFDPQLSFARAVELPLQQPVSDFAIAEPPGAILAASHYELRGETSGRPQVASLVQITKDGEKIDPRGMLLGATQPSLEFFLQSWLAIDPTRATIYVATAYGAIQQWSLDSRGQDHWWVVQPGWLDREPPAGPTYPRETKPSGRIAGLAVNAHGNILQFGSVADTDWRPSAGAADIDVFDTIVDVIDTASAALLFRERRDEVLKPIKSPGVAYSMVDSPDGTRSIQLWRYRIER